MTKVIYSMRLRFAAMSYGMYDYFALFLSPETIIDAQFCIGMVIDGFKIIAIDYDSNTDIYTLKNGYITKNYTEYYDMLLNYTNKGWVQVQGLTPYIFETCVPQWLSDGRPDKIKLR